MMAIVGTLAGGSYVMSNYSVSDLISFAERGAVKYGLTQDSTEVKLESKPAQFEEVVVTPEEVIPEDVGRIKPNFNNKRYYTRSWKYILEL